MVYRAKRLGAAGQWLLRVLKEEVGNATAATAQVLVRSNVFSIVGNCMYILRREIDIPRHDRLETENLLSDLNDFIRIWRPHIEHMNQQNPLFGRFFIDLNEDNKNSDEGSIGDDSVQIRAQEIAADYKHREMIANRGAATAEYFIIREWLLEHHPITHRNFIFHMQGLIDNEQHRYS